MPSPVIAWGDMAFLLSRIARTAIAPLERNIKTEEFISFRGGGLHGAFEIPNYRRAPFWKYFWAQHFVTRQHVFNIHHTGSACVSPRLCLFPQTPSIQEPSTMSWFVRRTHRVDHARVRYKLACPICRNGLVEQRRTCAPCRGPCITGRPGISRSL